MSAPPGTDLILGRNRRGLYGGSATCAEAGYVESDWRSAGRSAALSGARDVAIDAVAVRAGVGDHVRRVAHRFLVPRLRCAVRRAARVDDARDVRLLVGGIDGYRL